LSPHTTSLLPPPSLSGGVEREVTFHRVLVGAVLIGAILVSAISPTRVFIAVYPSPRTSSACSTIVVASVQAASFSKSIFIEYGLNQNKEARTELRVVDAWILTDKPYSHQSIHSVSFNLHSQFSPIYFHPLSFQSFDD
ncbi:hypothetical protein HN51_026335, partial [Arachis hypogaea]